MLNVVLQLDLSEDPKSKNLPEMSSVTSHYVEYMYHNGFYGKKFLDYGSSHFPIRMRADILDFNIWIFLFLMIIRSFYTKGDFCIMI